MNNGIKRLQELFQQLYEINNEQRQLWIEYVVFSWQWWVGVGLVVIPWMIWFLLRKKDSSLRLLSAGFFIIFICSWLDSIGIQLGLWRYKYEVIPFTPAFIPWDISLMPVVTMFFLQVKPDINLYIKGVIFGLFLAFVAEPVSILIDLYEPLNWKHIYSFPIYFSLYFFSHRICYGRSYNILTKK